MDLSTCCHVPVIHEAVFGIDGYFDTCSKCGDECGIVNPENQMETQ